MDSVISIEASRVLVADAVLWPRVRDFLWDFVPQVHESWLSGVGMPSGQPVDHEDAQPASGLDITSPRVKEWILQELGVEPCFHAFPQDDGSRLLLLDGATLLAIAKWLGALACANVLRRTTDGATVRSFKASLQGVYPEIFGYTAYFKGMEKFGGLVAEWLDGADGGRKLDGDLVIAIGVAFLDDTLAHLPAALLKRFRLKLPKALPPRPSLPFPQLSGHLTTQPLNLQLLLKLRFPEAYALCSS